MFESLFSLVARSVNRANRPSGSAPVQFIGDAEDFFDDCPICQAQRKAIEEGRDLSMAEYEAAAAEIERSGLGLVGRF